MASLRQCCCPWGWAAPQGHRDLAAPIPYACIRSLTVHDKTINMKAEKPRNGTNIGKQA